MSPKVSQAHLEARRQQIIGAAATCFARNGFHKTTMRDIFTEARLSPGAVYRYFSSKDQIIQAMCAASSEWNLQRIQDAAANRGSAAVFRGLADAFFDELTGEEAVASARLCVHLWAEGLRNGVVAAAIREGYEQAQDRITEIVRRAQSQGDVNSQLDADYVGRVVISLFEGLLIQQCFYPEFDVDAYKRVVTALGLGDFWFRPAEDASKDAWN